MGHRPGWWVLVTPLENPVYPPSIVGTGTRNLLSTSGTSFRRPNVVGTRTRVDTQRLLSGSRTLRGRRWDLVRTLPDTDRIPHLTLLFGIFPLSTRFLTFPWSVSKLLRRQDYLHTIGVTDVQNEGLETLVF